MTKVDKRFCQHHCNITSSNLQTRKRDVVDNIYQSASYVNGYLQWKFEFELLPYQEVEQMESIDFYSVELVSGLILSFKNSILHMRRNTRFQIWASQNVCKKILVTAISFMRKPKTVLETLKMSLNKSFGGVQPSTILLPMSIQVYVAFQNCYYQET